MAKMSNGSVPPAKSVAKSAGRNMPTPIEKHAATHSGAMKACTYPMKPGD